MDHIGDNRRSLTVHGVILPIDAAGRVDLSMVNRFSRGGTKSPAEWLKTAKCRRLIVDVAEQNGLHPDEVWLVEGIRKGARTWVHPVVAGAYIEDVGAGPRAITDVIERLELLESRVADLEDLLLDEEP